jgi:hypothetical protein
VIVISSQKESSQKESSCVENRNRSKCSESESENDLKNYDSDSTDDEIRKQVSKRKRSSNESSQSNEEEAKEDKERIVYDLNDSDDIDGEQVIEVDFDEMILSQPWETEEEVGEDNFSGQEQERDEALMEVAGLEYQEKRERIPIVDSSPISSPECILIQSQIPDERKEENSRRGSRLDDGVIDLDLFELSRNELKKEKATSSKHSNSNLKRQKRDQKSIYNFFPIKITENDAK